MDRLYEENYNHYGCLMKIVEYNNCSDIVVEFQDEYKLRVNNTYNNFKRGCIRNPYYPTAYGVGITGIKYPTVENGRNTKEYRTWLHVLERSFDDGLKEKQPAYKDATCCNEWLNYETFYEWLHSQENFDKWYHGKRWALDKDIIIKGNKIYSPDTCCLVPQNVNCLLLGRNSLRGKLPIGVKRSGNKFQANCGNPFTGKAERFGNYDTPEEAFCAYKLRREGYIKQVAEIEYVSGNITKQCYDGLMNYSIEIDD